MGKRGPQPKPSAQKRREGTWRPDRAAKNEPMPAPGMPEVPAEIAADKDAVLCWDRTAPQLLEDRVLTPRDWLALAGLCRSYAVAVKADRAAKKGVIIQSPYGPKENPAVRVSRLAWTEVRKFAESLGLTPAARTRVSAHSSQQPAQMSSAESFLFGEERIAGHIRPA